MKKTMQFLALAILLAGCSGDGIFYNLENEEKIKDANNLSDSIPLNQMLIYPGQNQYVLNGKRVWHSTIGTSTTPWSTYPVPSGYDRDATFPSIGLLNGNLYATIISPDANARSGLLKYNPSSGSWDELFYYEKNGSGSSDYTYHNMYLFQTKNGGNDELYLNLVEYYKDSDYDVSIISSQLFYYSNATGASKLADGQPSSGNLVTLDTGSLEPMPIVAMTSDTVSSKNYLVYNESSSGFTRGVVASAGTGSPQAFSKESSVPGSYNYTTIYYSSVQDMLFIGTQADDNKHPILYETGGNWYSKEWKSDVQFSSFCDINDIQSGIILAGTQAYSDPTSSSSILGDGYIEIDVSTSKTDPRLQSNNFSSDNNYNSSDLSDATIKQFLYDSTYNRLYAATSSYGLWLNTSDGSNRDWSQE